MILLMGCINISSSQESSSSELHFEGISQNILRKFAEEAYKFCPDAVEQNAGSIEALEIKLIRAFFMGLICLLIILKGLDFYGFAKIYIPRSTDDNI